MKEITHLYEDTYQEDKRVKGGKRMAARLTITEAAQRIGVTPKTLIRWEKSGKIKNPKRDWRGWRVYTEDEIRNLEEKINQLY